MANPKFVDDEAYNALRAADLETFNRLIAGRATVDFSDADLRSVDLRHADIGIIRLRGAYLRSADLRGLDLRKVDIEGCSLLDAQVSGTFFPDNLSAQEILMSLQYGTRLRVMRPWPHSVRARLQRRRTSPIKLTNRLDQTGEAKTEGWCRAVCNCSRSM